jgi:hypothetical protein
VNKKGITRRALLGWAASLLTSAGVVLVFASSRQMNGPIARLVNYLRAESSRRRQIARQRRQAYRAIEPWRADNLIINTKRSLPEKIAHWPQPNLVKLRYQVNRNHSQALALDHWDQEIRPGSGTRFERRHSGPILEVFALSKLKENGVQFEGIDEALRILKFARSLKENKKDRRLGELVARLLCLRSATFKEATALIATEKLSEILKWTQDENAVRKWYDKTVDTKYGLFRKKLRSRIHNAAVMIHGASSSE